MNFVVSANALICVSIVTVTTGHRAVAANCYHHILSADSCSQWR